MENGGLLDEVIFARKTDVQEDIEYLEELLATNPRYSKHVATSDYGSWLMGSWEGVKGNDIYIKIDDDVVRLITPKCAVSADLQPGFHRRWRHRSHHPTPYRASRILCRLCQRGQQSSTHMGALQPRRLQPAIPP